MVLVVPPRKEDPAVPMTLAALSGTARVPQTADVVLVLQVRV